MLFEFNLPALHETLALDPNHELTRARPLPFSACARGNAVQMRVMTVEEDSVTPCCWAGA